MDQEIYNKITSKKEFSKLPKKDVELAFSHFERRQVSEEEKIRLTRDLLRKVFSGFSSGKLLSLKNKSPEWILRKHLSTRERLPYYQEAYKKIFGNLKLKEKERVTVLDLGAGINGFSYNFFPRRINYIGVEAVGQLVNLVNHYFETKGTKECKVIHDSLFELEKIKKYLKQIKGIRIIFLFKTLDSLEMLEKDYSKKFLKETVPLADLTVVSFATKSMISRKKFSVSRKWILDFISHEFVILNDFELGGERYLVLRGR
jgi:hypothetical protein